MNFLVNAILVLRTNMQPELEFFQWISDQNIPERGLRKAALIPLWSIGFVTVVPSLSGISLSANPWTTARQALPSFTIFQSLCKLMSIESVMPSNHLILCYPLLYLPSIFPSIRVFSSESALCIKWPKSIGASASILPMNIQGWFLLGLTGLISLLPKLLSRVFSNTNIQNHQFFGAQPSLWSNFHIHTRLLEKS